MIEILISSAGYWFQAKAKNGQIVATSEMYKTKWGCKKGIISLLRLCGHQNVLIIDRT